MSIVNILPGPFKGPLPWGRSTCNGMICKVKGRGHDEKTDPERKSETEVNNCQRTKNNKFKSWRHTDPLNLKQS